MDPDEIIQALDDGTKITLAELGEVKTYVSEEDGKTHVSFILKVVQSKEMIIMFLGVATLVVHTFLYQCIEKPRIKRKKCNKQQIINTNK